MQTIYYTIGKPAAQECAGGKIIDLGQYRRQLERLERREEREWEEAPVQPRPRASQRRNRWGLFWDAVASLGVVAMAVTFCAELLL